MRLGLMAAPPLDGEAAFRQAAIDLVKPGVKA
jgi:hypothetical protein